MKVKYLKGRVARKRIKVVLLFLLVEPDITDPISVVHLCGSPVCSLTWLAFPTRVSLISLRVG